MLKQIYISNKRCSFELSINQKKDWGLQKYCYAAFQHG